MEEVHNIELILEKLSEGEFKEHAEFCLSELNVRINQLIKLKLEGTSENPISKETQEGQLATYYEQKYEDAKKTIIQLESQLEEMKEQEEEIRMSHQNAADEFRASLVIPADEEEDEIAGRENRLLTQQSMQNLAQEMEKQLEEKDELIKYLESQVNEQKTEIYSQQRVIQEQQDDQKELESANAFLKERIQGISGSKEENNEEIANLQIFLDQKTAELQKKEEEIKRLQSQNQSLEDQCVEGEKRYSQLKDTQKNLEVQLDDQKRENIIAKRQHQEQIKKYEIRLNSIQVGKAQLKNMLSFKNEFKSNEEPTGNSLSTPERPKTPELIHLVNFIDTNQHLESMESFSPDNIALTENDALQRLEGRESLSTFCNETLSQQINSQTSITELKGTNARKSSEDKFRKGQGRLLSVVKETNEISQISSPKNTPRTGKDTIGNWEQQEEERMHIVEEENKITLDEENDTPKIITEMDMNKKPKQLIPPSSEDVENDRKTKGCLACNIF